MSKPINIEELKIRIAGVTEQLKNFLMRLSSSSDEKQVKRSSLISHWVKDYIVYQNKEDSFSPEKLLRYKRGDIIQVQFGYRIGSELGGLHYAIVINVKSSKKAPIITVVPLKSLKPNFKETDFQIQLGSGIYDLVRDNINKAIKAMLADVNSLPDCDEGSEEEKIAVANFMFNNHDRIMRAKNSVDSLEKLKLGSVADVCQITTISKLRIVNPKRITDSLYGVRATDEDMEKIQNIIIKQFCK